MADGNAVLIVGAVIAGAVVIDYGTKALKGAFTSSGSTTTAAASPAAASGPAGAEKMLAAAQAAAAANIAYSQDVQTSGVLAGFRADCSGFVSYIVSQAIPDFGDQTTVTMASDPNLQAGVGQYVTLWDRAEAGDAGHVIIDILGNWFESGGQATDGPSAITAEQAQAEIANGLTPYHPVGM